MDNNTLEAVSVSVVPGARRARLSLHNVTPGNTFTDTLFNSRKVMFTATIIAPEQIETSTTVWEDNIRDQSQLCESSLTDILASIKVNGQTSWAIGRKIATGAIEVADGSRRRQATMLAQKDYKILVADLTDEEMEVISITGNFYKAPSTVERGHRYKRLVAKLGSQRKAEKHLQTLGENISRRGLQRCIKASDLPKQVIQCFHNIDDVSPAIAEQLHLYAFHNAKLCPHMNNAIQALGDTQNLSPHQISNKLINDCLALQGNSSKPAKTSKPKPIIRNLCDGRVKVEEYATSIKVDIQDINAEQMKEIEEWIAAVLGH